MNTITFEGKEYFSIFSESFTDHTGKEDFQRETTNVTRKKTIFPIFPIKIKDNWYWMKKINVNQRFFLYRSLQFDDGWSYSFYWGKWEGEWRTESIVK